MVRMMFSIFGADFIFDYLPYDKIIVTLAVVCILAGSFYALAQKDLKKMLCYLIVAEVGYMVGGVWLNTEDGLRGALYHIISDGFMTLCLFLAAGMIIAKTRNSSIDCFYGIYKKMPVTMLGFTVAAFSMIGIPPSCGFFSKWYLIRGAMEAGQFHYILALLISSLVNAILFFRIIEKAYFGKLPEGDEHGHGSHHSEKVAVDEAPTSMIIPLLICAAALILIGVFNNEIIKILNEFIVTSGVANA